MGADIPCSHQQADPYEAVCPECGANLRAFTDDDIVNLIDMHGYPLSSRYIAGQFGVSSVWRRLLRLEAAGRIFRHGNGKSTRWEVTE